MSGKIFLKPSSMVNPKVVPVGTVPLAVGAQNVFWGDSHPTNHFTASAGCCYHMGLHGRSGQSQLAVVA